MIKRRRVMRRPSGAGLQRLLLEHTYEMLEVDIGATAFVIPTLPGVREQEGFTACANIQLASSCIISHTHSARLLLLREIGSTHS